MSFTVTVEMGQLERKLGVLARQADNLDKPLRQFGAYLRKRAMERAKAQNFPPLAKSTLEARAEKGIRQLETKLHRDLRKAVQRAEKAEKKSTRGITNREAIIAEFQRRHRAGGSLAQRVDLQPLTLKQTASLTARTDRSVERAVGAPILGRLPRSLVVEVMRAAVKVVWRTHGEWSEIHNEGGTAGRGAKIPKREILTLEDRDIDVFVEILKKHHMVAFD